MQLGRRLRRAGRAEPGQLLERVRCAQPRLQLRRRRSPIRQGAVGKRGKRTLGLLERTDGVLNGGGGDLRGNVTCQKKRVS